MRLIHIWLTIVSIVDFGIVKQTTDWQMEALMGRFQLHFSSRGFLSLCFDQLKSLSNLFMQWKFVQWIIRESEGRKGNVKWKRWKNINQKEITSLRLWTIGLIHIPREYIQLKIESKKFQPENVHFNGGRSSRRQSQWLPSRFYIHYYSFYAIPLPYPFPVHWIVHIWYLTKRK